MINKFRFRKTFLLLFTILLVCLLLFDFYERIAENQKIKQLSNDKRTLYLIGKVYSNTNVSRSRQVFLHYSFFVDGKTYYSSRKIVKKNRVLPEMPFYTLVAADSANPVNNFLLCTKDDFRIFKKDVPDTLALLSDFFY